ncbi:hypothetical protein ACFLWU_05120 [Chloroflexota bacterium]
MDLTKLVLDIIDLFIKAYSIVLIKPYATVKLEYLPEKGSSGKATQASLSLNIINDGIPDIDVQKIWLVTSYNRIVFSEFLDSKTPVLVAEDDRVTYSIPIQEIKSALNRKVGDTIIKAVALDKNGRQHVGRVNKATQEELAR